jgi:hypothetical protein
LESGEWRGNKNSKLVKLKLGEFLNSKEYTYIIPLSSKNSKKLDCLGNV